MFINITMLVVITCAPTSLGVVPLHELDSRTQSFGNGSRREAVSFGGVQHATL